MKTLEELFYLWDRATRAGGEPDVAARPQPLAGELSGAGEQADEAKRRELEFHLLRGRYAMLRV